MYNLRICLLWRFEAATVAKLPTVIILDWVVIDWATIGTLDVVVWLLTDNLTTAAIVGPLLLTDWLILFEELALIGVGLIVFYIKHKLNMMRIIRLNYNFIIN